MKSIFKAFFDKTAQVKSGPSQSGNYWDLLILMIASASAFLGNMYNFLTLTFGIPGPFIQIFLILLCLIRTVMVIAYKEKTVFGESYTFGQTKRNIAKCVFVIFVFSLFFLSVRTTNELWSLPKVIYGYVYNDKTGEPIADARMKVKDANLRDITSGVWFTDSRGFYVIKASERISRRGNITVYPEGCSNGFTLSVLSIFELKDSPHTFSHSIEICNEKE